MFKKVKLFWQFNPRLKLHLQWNGIIMVRSLVQPGTIKSTDLLIRDSNNSLQKLMHIKVQSLKNLVGWETLATT